MKNYFNTAVKHKITEANINTYEVPAMHPERCMKEHDFIYVTEGQWEIGQNGKSYVLKKHSLLILAAGQRHYGIAPSFAGTRTMYFHVSCEPGDRCFEDMGNANAEDLFDTHIDATFNRNIKKYFFEVVNSKLSGNDKRAALFFELLLCEMSLIKQQTENTAISEKISHIIHQNPEKFFSNSELAQRLSVSVKTAETKFKAHFGVTIHRYMLEFKTDQAISYFRNFPEMPIKEVSKNLGFYDEYHFSKQFKRLTGLSPSEYKRKIDDE